MEEFRVLLLGGPPSFPDHLRNQTVRSIDEKIKVRFRAGYEHFQYRGECRNTSEGRVQLFSWCARTAVAE